MRFENDESYMPIKKPVHVLSFSVWRLANRSERSSLEEFLLRNNVFLFA